MEDKAPANSTDEMSPGMTCVVGSQQWLYEVFTYRPSGVDQHRKYAHIHDLARDLAEAIFLNCPPCADRSDAIRKLREVVMTANASVALKGLV